MSVHPSYAERTPHLVPGVLHGLLNLPADVVATPATIPSA